MTRRGNDAEERDKLIAAIIKILRRESEASSGRLSVKAVAEEAGLARTSLTHKHQDIKDLVILYQQIFPGPSNPDNSAKRIATLTEEVQQLSALNQSLAAQATLAALVYTDRQSAHLKIVAHRGDESAQGRTE